MKTSSPDLVAGFMAGWLQGHLDEGKRVLWLLSGGSGIATAVAAWQLLGDAPGKLVIGQIDERYGPVDHPDSNWKQLQDAGLTPRPRESALPILTGLPLAQTVAAYRHQLEEELSLADVRIGFLGMGADGHTAGILPHSPAVKSAELVADYEAADYQRITITAAVIERLDEAVVLANGHAKAGQIERLREEVAVEDQPAQLLKRARHAVVFSDTVAP